MAVAREVIDAGMGQRLDPLGGMICALRDAREPAKLWQHPGSAPPRLAPNDPAALLVSDFARGSPGTVGEDCPIDAALRELVCAGHEALLVVRAGAVIGLLAEGDIDGPRTLDLLRYSAFRSRSEIRVAHVMSPWDGFPILDWRSICASRVRHVEEWARNTRAAHALVVEQREGTEYARGLLSRARLERELGCAL